MHCETTLSEDFMKYILQVSLCKLLRNAHDILSEAFHKI